MASPIQFSGCYVIEGTPAQVRRVGKKLQDEIKRTYRGQRPNHGMAIDYSAIPATQTGRRKIPKRLQALVWTGLDALKKAGEASFYNKNVRPMLNQWEQRLTGGNQSLGCVMAPLALPIAFLFNLFDKLSAAIFGTIPANATLSRLNAQVVERQLKAGAFDPLTGKKRRTRKP